LQQQEPPSTSLSKDQQQQPELSLDTACPHQLQDPAQASPQPSMPGAGCIPAAPALAGASTGRPAGQAAKHLLMLQAAVSGGSAKGKQHQQQAQVTAAEPHQEAAGKNVQAQVQKGAQDAGRGPTWDTSDPCMAQPGAQELTASVSAGRSSPVPSTAPSHDPEHPATTSATSHVSPDVEGTPAAPVLGAREEVAAAPAGPHAAGSQQEGDQQPEGAATSHVLAAAAAAVQTPVVALADVPEPSPSAAPHIKEPAQPITLTATAVHPPAQPGQPSQQQQQQQQQVGPLHEPQQEQSQRQGPQQAGSDQSGGQQQGASGAVSSGAVSPGSEDADAQVLR
jgi:hypothetical protein